MLPLSSDADLVARTLLDRFGEDAHLRAAFIAYSLHELGQIEEAYIWQRIVWAVDGLRSDGGQAAVRL